MNIYTLAQEHWNIFAYVQSSCREGCALITQMHQKGILAQKPTQNSKNVLDDVITSIFFGL